MENQSRRTKGITQVVPNRHCRLLTLLSGDERGKTLEELARLLGVNARTVRRDLATLAQSNVPLVEMTGPHGLKYWHIDEKLVVGVRFAYDEAAALYLSRRFLEPLVGTFLWDAADSALAKIKKSLLPTKLVDLERLLNVFSRVEGQEISSAKGAFLEALIIGCEESREVTITYRSLASDTEETYAIQPYEIHNCGGTIYITGYSCKSQSVRQWKFQRMSQALAGHRKFTRPKQIDFTLFGSANDAPQTVRIKFSRRVARFVQEHRWHESEQLTELEDGSILAEYRLTETVLIKNRVLSYGKNAEILAPESLRNEMRAEIESMREFYQ